MKKNAYTQVKARAAARREVIKAAKRIKGQQKKETANA